MRAIPKSIAAIPATWSASTLLPKTAAAHSTNTGSSTVIMIAPAAAPILGIPAENSAMECVVPKTVNANQALCRKFGHSAARKHH